jgi:hypothetical protein
LKIPWPLHPAQGHGIAEHDKVPPVLDHLKSAPLDLVQEQVAPCYALHIANLALHDATAPRLGRVEELREPCLGAEVIGRPCHGRHNTRSWLSVG